MQLLLNCLVHGKCIIESRADIDKVESLIRVLGLEMNVSVGQPSREDLEELPIKDSKEREERVSSEVFVERHAELALARPW